MLRKPFKTNCLGPSTVENYDPKALHIMEKMGYKPGGGLGKHEQGSNDIIALPIKVDKSGLGHIEDVYEELPVSVIESVHWLKNKEKQQMELKIEWIVEGPKCTEITPMCCDINLVKQLFQTKEEVFRGFHQKSLNQARLRANPFEKLRSGIFMNRAAMKMANIDKISTFINFQDSTIYFVDACAGPGGFTEYVLWRRGWTCKGFGMTLKGAHDFKLSKSPVVTSATFQALYGEDNTGDITNLANIDNFAQKVVWESQGGVHFIMADGGFSVEGQEHLQEVLSKQLYICECLLALKVLRQGGNFVTKLFDTFTEFSIGLIYLMYRSFERIAIHKPNTSRPANSERYLICKGFKSTSKNVENHLVAVVRRLQASKQDVERIVEIPIKRFLDYITGRNNSIAKRQIHALKLLKWFCSHPGFVDSRQESMRNQCMDYWEIPTVFHQSTIDVDNLCDYLNIHVGLSLPTCFEKYRFACMVSTEQERRANYFAAIDSCNGVVYCDNQWTKVQHLKLARGTLVFGELVKETSLLEDETVKTRTSLHIVDAYYLGNVCIANLTFDQRRQQIAAYCNALNKESQLNPPIRIRQKPIYCLAEASSLLQDLDVELPLIGFKSVWETHSLNSVMLFDPEDSDEKYIVPVTQKELIEKLFIVQ